MLMQYIPGSTQWSNLYARITSFSHKEQGLPYYYADQVILFVYGWSPRFVMAELKFTLWIIKTSQPYTELDHDSLPQSKVTLWIIQCPKFNILGLSWCSQTLHSRSSRFFSQVHHGRVKLYILDHQDFLNLFTVGLCPPTIIQGILVNAMHVNTHAISNSFQSILTRLHVYSFIMLLIQQFKIQCTKLYKNTCK